MTNKAPKNAWAKGTSGNPKGKPPGSGKVQQLRQALGKDVDAIIETVRTQALAGDLVAAKLVLERLLPPLKPQEQAVELPLPEDASLTEAGRSILGAVAAGDIAPGQGSQLIAALGGLARVVEIDELERRLAALEERNAKS